MWEEFYSEIYPGLPREDTYRFMFDHYIWLLIDVEVKIVKGDSTVSAIFETLGYLD